MNQSPMNWEFLYQSLYNILYALPVILVLIAGIVLALQRWRKHPRVSMLVLIASLVSIFDSIFFPLLNGLLAGWLIRQGWRYEEVSKVLMAVYIVASVMAAVVAGFWLAAAFGDRSEQNLTLKRAHSDD